MVTASGEIRPKDYTNVLGEGIGKITEIAVKEGDFVKQGDVLLRIENIQPGADVQAQAAGSQRPRSSRHRKARPLRPNYDCGGPLPSRERQADLEKANLNWQRAQRLYKEQLISKTRITMPASRFTCKCGCPPLPPAKPK